MLLLHAFPPVSFDAAHEVVAGCLREQLVISTAIDLGGLVFYPQRSGATALHWAAATGIPEVLRCAPGSALASSTLVVP